MYFNPLNEYLEDSQQIIQYDIEYDEIPEKERSVFFRKLQYRLGYIVVLFNYLDRKIDECILNQMNEHGEDERVWILIKDFNFDKKVKSLNELYQSRMRLFNNFTYSDQIKEIFTRLENVRIKRNIYMHANWLNDINLESFEVKVKKIDNKKGYLRTRKHVKLNDIEIFINEIDKLFNDLDSFDEEFSVIDFISEKKS